VLLGVDNLAVCQRRRCIVEGELLPKPARGHIQDAGQGVDAGGQVGEGGVDAGSQVGDDAAGWSDLRKSWRRWRSDTDEGTTNTQRREVTTEELQAIFE
jgi:hypothetical protein